MCSTLATSTTTASAPTVTRGRWRGVDCAGRLILVTADGIATKSEGLTLTEEAKLMRSLSATDAMNLDGGGSTSFVVDGSTINMTSDATGPRTIGDSIQIIPSASLTPHR